MSEHTDVRLARPATDDVEALAELLAAFDDEFGTAHDDQPVLAARFRRILTGDAAFALLAHGVGGAARAAPVGFALVTLRPAIWFDGPVATLDELYVAPEERGAGHGTGLLAAVRAELRHRGCPELHVNVDEVDAGARRFYERHGLVNVEREEDGRMLLFVGPVGEPE
ncbi:GNAT family N-acetyltransferase [Nocardioidaceae bacterium]|nr:GNAT family N-acetyltransferase [Nocardioidaceae bacterium]